MANSLAQIGVDPWGMLVALILSSLIICLWFFLLSLSFIGIVVGVALALWGKRGSVVVLTISAVAAATLAYLGYCSESPPTVHVNLVVDPTLSLPPGKWISWGVDAGTMAYSGNLRAHVEFPPGYTIDERAELVDLDSRDGKLYSILVQSPGLPFSDACAMTDKYLREWNLPRRDFDLWRAAHLPGGRLPTNDEYRNFATGSGGVRYPSLDIELRQNVADDNAWNVNLEVCWPPQAIRASLAASTRVAAPRP